jgi:hypothetical protein
MRKFILALLAALGLLVGIGVSPALAWEDDNHCVTVNNNDGTHAFAACITHLEGWGTNNWETQDERVWNISPANGGHTDLMTNVVWHGKYYSGSNGGVTWSMDFGNIADGGTDWAPSGTFRLNDNSTTVWVEVHDSFAPTCNRVFFANDGSTSTTTC